MDLIQVTIDSIGDAVTTTDLAMRVEYLNPVAEALTGCTLGETRGRPLREMFNIVNGYNKSCAGSPRWVWTTHGTTCWTSPGLSMPF